MNGVNSDSVLREALDKLIAQRAELDEQREEIVDQLDKLAETIEALEKFIGRSDNGNQRKAESRLVLTSAVSKEKKPMGRPRSENYRERKRIRRGPWKFPCPHASEGNCVGGSGTVSGLIIHKAKMHSGEKPEKKKLSSAFEDAKKAMGSPQNQKECVCKDSFSDGKNHVYGVHKNGGKCMMPGCQCPEFMEST